MKLSVKCNSSRLGGNHELWKRKNINSSLSDLSCGGLYSVIFTPKWVTLDPFIPS